ncbi:hypothetical protein B0H10DRAFT_1809862 [Mycena sp. CBHHK59/15]|nr:hypothetical protein B0H10DRAFT_1809862 [Mycena sp. CBHHK59/15]
MDAHEELPRISISSMHIWLRIKSEFTKAIETKVDEYARQNSLPANRRNAMLRNSQQYIENTFKIAQHNIRINGRDFDSLNLTNKPFDEALDRRIWSLASNRLQWHRKIAETRRETPIAHERMLQDLFREHENLDLDLSTTDSDPEENSDSVDVNVDGELMRDVFGQISAVTGELSQTIPTQQERSERSRVVEAEYKALKP